MNLLGKRMNETHRDGGDPTNLRGETPRGAHDSYDLFLEKPQNVKKSYEKRRGEAESISGGSQKDIAKGDRRKVEGAIITR